MLCKENVDNYVLNIVDFGEKYHKLKIAEEGA